MSYPMIAGILLFFAGVVAARIIGEKGIKFLSIEEKARFLDAFSKYRMYSSFPILGAAILVIAFTFLFPAISALLVILFVLLCLAYLVVINLMTFGKLKSLNPPPEYRRNFIISRMVQYAGFVCFFLLFGYEMLFNCGYMDLLPFGK